MGKNRTSARNIAPWRKRRWLPGPNETANYVLPIPLETTPQPTIRIRKRDRDRAERIRLAGGPKPKLRERAVRLALENLDGPGPRTSSQARWRQRRIYWKSPLRP
ncbi:MAG: hypothetical protein EOS11_11125 [Mesorhizobium sp.]|nr:MAG: hypothetical protein EOS00_15340 [Mesorhizobium sp.]RWO25965.1 MAG: hypothetical protein EOS09_09580 [Mesorhizobium sp.]RWO28536.1 MAG: hypothetical protein EOS10_24120 [Mesorhizobium sp.]RWO45074.1 MAG: hypothetical protein EOS11_11125 [Mesorhizobium sp.]RWO56902.1 MAG: hypothetical protein EOS14_25695 [Mesorhizobium sp.]